MNDLDIIITELTARALEMKEEADALRDTRGALALKVATGSEKAAKLDKLDTDIASAERARSDALAALDEARKQQAQSKDVGRLAVAAEACKAIPGAAKELLKAYETLSAAIDALVAAHAAAVDAERIANRHSANARPEVDPLGALAFRFNATTGTSKWVERALGGHPLPDLAGDLTTTVETVQKRLLVESDRQQQALRQKLADQRAGRPHQPQTEQFLALKRAFAGRDFVITEA